MAKNIKTDANMQRCAEMLVMKDVNGLTNEDIAYQLGIDISTLYRWKARPDFVQYQNELAEQFNKSFLSDAYCELRNIMMHSHSDTTRLKAVELLLRNQGRIKEVQDTNVNVQAELSVDERLKRMGL